MPHWFDDIDMTPYASPAAPEDPSDPLSVIQFLGVLADVCTHGYTQRKCPGCMCFRSSGDGAAAVAEVELEAA